ncbi:hypothetical protein BEL04_14960 [Mucilaginibacter sp. PPCGB 2223]|uniref:DUF4397 domain-containing protein n=1 Tax=Mucilaginibacter sp. PPCGB 2223 TaxID=1886027 RepID=UPI0008268283|nr:DUF4397 domain-containing protein [Mucilaginibacter sp. PPCGB 2223]OCX51330.1 hypothetical protein BEL04_14960 [Mucilaginibacter sp. PPCGB 2223]
MNIYSKTKRSGLVKLLMLFVVAAIGFTSCTKYHDGYYYDPGPVAQLNVVNASPTSASYNFALGNNFVNGSPLLFGQRSGYINAYSGKRLFSLTSGGTTNVITTDTLNLAVNGYYSLFITGATGTPTFFFTQDDLSAPLLGKAKVRFIQLSPDGGPFDLSIQNGATLFTNQAYQTASAFTNIDPGTYTFQLKADQTGAITTLPAETISAGRIYTVWVKGLVDGSGDYAISGKVNVNN